MPQNPANSVARRTTEDKSRDVEWKRRRNELSATHLVPGIAFVFVGLVAQPPALLCQTTSSMDMTTEEEDGAAHATVCGGLVRGFRVEVQSGTKDPNFQSTSQVP